VGFANRARDSACMDSGLTMAWAKVALARTAGPKEQSVFAFADEGARGKVEDQANDSSSD